LNAKGVSFLPPLAAGGDLNANAQRLQPKTGRLTALLLAGALSGLIASVPMGFAMMGLNRVLPGRNRPSERALPPKQITGKVADQAGAEELMRPGPRWEPTTWLAHLGYGAVTASLYPLVARKLPLPAVVTGIFYALTVWAGSYMGWLPVTGILPPATEQSRRRNTVMVASHVLWGALTGLLTKSLISSPRDGYLIVE
jgi:uncharacterized membrane protein YagU involved in acid resistance